MPSLTSIRHLIIDMDGVLWHGETALPGLVEFFAFLRRRAIRFILATNNASQTPDQYVAKLEQMGVAVTRDEILTSAQAAAIYLSGIAPKGEPVYTIGEAGVTQALAEQGFTLSDGEANYVVVGMDRGLTWEKLAQATLNIRAGATFIGANPDTTLPTERGIVHGNGAVLALLQTATEVAPVIVGKPQPIMYQQALARLGGSLADTVALGDRLETDILGAVNAGLRSILVLSGISSREHLAGVNYRPDWIFTDIADLTMHWQAEP
ncbi:MAG: HAD family hydrolase [Chloroflexi bacterium]|nr:HAD family hydrolase [Chloroflexota bacterium]